MRRKDCGTDHQCWTQPELPAIQCYHGVTVTIMLGLATFTERLASSSGLKAHRYPLCMQKVHTLQDSSNV